MCVAKKQTKHTQMEFISKTEVFYVSDIKNFQTGEQEGFGLGWGEGLFTSYWEECEYGKKQVSLVLINSTTGKNSKHMT